MQHVTQSISPPNPVIEVTRKLQRDLSSIDILIQNAATFMAGPLEQAKLEDLDALYRTNVRAAFALTQALLPMLKARRGQIVFVNSSSKLSERMLVPWVSELFSPLGIG